VKSKNWAELREGTEVSIRYLLAYWERAISERPREDSLPISSLQEAVYCVPFASRYFRALAASELMLEMSTRILDHSTARSAT